MNKQYLRIGFIGAGAIGSLFGGYLAGITSDIYSIEIIFFCNKAHADMINKKGLILNKNQDIRVVKNIKAFEDEKFFEEKINQEPSFKFDFIFLTTKAYDIETAMRQYELIINASKYFVILQNGIGNEDIAIHYCDKRKIIRIITTDGALLDKPGNLIHTGEGLTKIGFPFLGNFNLNAQGLEQAELNLKLLRDVLILSGFETYIVKDIIKECWEKVFINIGINAIGALTRLPNGKILENMGLKYIMGEAIKEAIKVAEMKNIRIPEKDYIAITFDVAMKTAENKNSMLQDILNRQPTEIDFINGRILKYAADLGIKVPVNEILTNLIKGLRNSAI